MREPSFNCVVVACARWEQDYIVEWISYYKAIGIDHIFLYCNDDDPSTLYEKVLPFAVGDMPFVTFTHFPYVGAQAQMYKNFLANHSHKTKWFSFLDIDEFLALKGFNNIKELTTHFEDKADVIYLNWLYFGNSGFATRPKGMILTQYTFRADSVNPYTKVLVRYDKEDVKSVLSNGETGFWHKWNPQNSTSKRYINILGDDMHDYYSQFPNSANSYLLKENNNHKMAGMTCVYHYAFKSEEDLERRIQRGVAGDFSGQVVFKKVIDSGNLTDFLKKFSAVEDLFLKKYWTKVLAEGAENSINKRPKSQNIALGKLADQSSHSEWSKGSSTLEDASLVVSGTFSNTYNCHTQLEEHPWWRVDLESIHGIKKIILFNRIDKDSFREKIQGFILDISTDMNEWTTLYHDENNLAFGGTDGKPFVWQSENTIYARFVRIRLPRKGLIHLNAVEVYEGLD